MLANILIKPGNIELREMKTPEPSYGEILVKIKAALTCGTDLKAFLRGHPLIPMPGVFGHEFSGIVTAIGKGVRKFKEGDAIMAVHTAPCLICSFCRRRFYNLCERIMSTKVLGAFAEYILLPSHVVKQNVFHKPENISFEEAAFLEPLSCVVHSVEKLRTKKGDSALIFGAGPIGLLHLLLLKGKKAIVAVADIKKERLKVARQLGADLVFRAMVKNSPSPAPLPSREGNNGGGIPSPLVRQDESVFSSPLMGKNKFVLPSPLVGERKDEGDFCTKKFANGIGFDYVFECTGKPDVWEASVNYVRKGGAVILFGGCESGTTVTYDTGRLHYDEITLKGVFHYTLSDVKKANKLLCEGELRVSRLISGRYPLGHVQRAFNKLATGAGIKFAIIP